MATIDRNPRPSAARGQAVSSRCRERLVLAGLAALFVMGGMVAFGRGLNNAFVSDDWVFLDQAFRATSMSNLMAAVFSNTSHFVRPLQGLVTWLLFRAFAVTPLPYHLASLLLHLINSALDYALVRRLMVVARLPDRWVPWLSAGSALLFFLNWHHHEAIFWFSAINEPLSAFLRLLCLLAAVEWLRRPVLRAGPYAVSLICMALALLAKESAISLPLELLLLSLFVQRARGITWTAARRVLMLAPFGLLAVAWLAWYLSIPGVVAGWEIQRSGLQVMRANPLEWLLRSLQYFDAHFVGGTLLGQHIPLLVAELAALALLVPAAMLRKQFLWLFALLWTVSAALPNVAVVPQEVATLHLPVLSVGVFGDRYLYYSAAGAGLALVTSFYWIGQEGQRIVAHWGRRREVDAAVALVVLLLCLNLARLLADEADWDAAGRLGQSIVKQAVQGMSGRTGTLCLVDLPDSYRGKYVFRNGIGGALDLADPQAHYSVRLLTGSSAGTSESTCAFVVDGRQMGQSPSRRYLSPTSY